MPDESHLYLLALGSNQRHHRFGPPRQVIFAALAALQDRGVLLCAHSRVIATAPIGPSARQFCNSCALVQTRLGPRQLLKMVKHIEADFGRRARGQRWRARVIDIDLILWDGGIWPERYRSAGKCAAGDRPNGNHPIGDYRRARGFQNGLIIPHPQLHNRPFVLGPASQITPCWRDPMTGFNTRQLFVRLTKPRPLTRWAFRTPGLAGGIPHVGP